MTNSRNIPKRRFKEFAVDREWLELKLGQLMDVGSVKRVHQSDWREKGIPFLRARDIVAEAKNEKLENPLYIDSELYNSYTALTGKVKKGDILVTGVGTIGVPLLIKNEQPLYFKDGNIIWFKNNNSLDGNFFYYSFISETIQKFISDVAGIGTVGTYTIDSGKKTPIYLPTSKEEQILIGKFFQNIDSLISLHQHKLDKLKNLKKSYLAELFPAEGERVPKRRFPGFEGEWEKKKLGEIMDVGSVKRVHQSDWRVNGVRFLRARDIVSEFKNEVSNDYLYIDEELYKAYTTISGKVEKGDVLVTGVGTIGVPLLIKSDKPLYFKDGNIIWFKNKNKIDGYFFYYSFIGNTIQKFIGDVAGIGTVGTYTIDSGKNTPISLPKSKEEQILIGNFLKTLDNSITLQQQKLDKLKDLKKAYLNELFV